MKTRQLSHRLMIGLCTLFIAILMFGLLTPISVKADEPNPDGRLNFDAFIPFAIYCNTTGVQLWRVNAQSIGELTVDVRMAQIITALTQSASSGQNIQTASSGYISLWALTSGQLEAVSVDPSRSRYSFRFGLDRCGVSAFTYSYGATPAPYYVQPQPVLSTVNGFVYTVQPGDTLYRLSLRYNTSVAALMGANNLGWYSIIYVGQRLVIPVGTLPIPNPYPTANPYPYGYVTPIPVYPVVNPNAYCPNPYTVQTGDTLFNISVRCGTSLNAIAYANGIVNPNTIYVGQVLVIPVGH